MRRPTSTIAREIGRNGGLGYRSSAAQRATKVRAARPKVRKLVADVALAAEVSAGLVKRWSPAEIAARLAVDYPENEAMRVSHETIYAALYLQGRGGLKRS